MDLNASDLLNLSTAEIMLGKLSAALPAIGAGVLVILGFLIAATLVRSVFRRIAAHSGQDRIDLFNLAGVVAFYTLLGFGLISGLGTMGMDVGALIAGLGLTGFALGFALRDAVSNLLAGVLILGYRPFHRGDHISVAGFEGVVSGIDLRYTTLQGDGKRYLIPNQTLFTNAIVLNQPVDAVQRPAAS
ncbi:mechanosensitive ion channel family protein [Skermanella stibiiresistens]|uniref:mechanosensitive ion channel family protein n=1 Tax=Skermanella stibiiresistens TaxID=913326 RepID=UPI0004B18F6B|nr:mechanosensitive ion channel domain-containing protein [Skermanella stibiiresistens]